MSTELAGGMRPSDLAVTLDALLERGWPLFLWGPPGCGKSDLVRQAAARKELELRDIRASLLDAVDLRGLPRIDGKQTSWCAPEFWPTAGRGVIFFDELPQAPPLVQSGLLQLLLDRRLGEYVLPQGWVMIAAGNRLQDRAGGHRVSTALMNRFIHLELAVSLEDWQAWAYGAGVQAEVRSFLNFKPSLLHDFEPNSGRLAFASPRSWKMVSDILPWVPMALAHQTFAGCVGDGPAAEFVNYLEICNGLPKPEEVLAAPSTHPVPCGPAASTILFALVGALTEKLRPPTAGGTPPQLLEAFAAYCSRLPEPFQMLAMRDAIAIRRNALLSPAFSRWLETLRKKGLFRVGAE